MNWETYTENLRFKLVNALEKHKPKTDDESIAFCSVMLKEVASEFGRHSPQTMGLLLKGLFEAAGLSEDEILEMGEDNLQQ